MTEDCRDCLDLLSFSWEQTVTGSLAQQKYPQSGHIQPEITQVTVSTNLSWVML